MIKTVCTHGGRFHCDEVMACAILRLLNPDLIVERLESYDEAILKSLQAKDIAIVDIGRQYDPANNLFDHHQGGTEDRDGFPRASAGLVWLEHGGFAIAKYLDLEVGEKLVSQIWKTVNENLIKGLDAHDDDDQYKVSATCKAGEVNVLTFPQFIAKKNALPNIPSPNGADPLTKNDAFKAAMILCELELCTYIWQAYEHELAKEELSKVVSIEGSIAVVEEKVKGHLTELVRELYPSVLFIVTVSNHPGNPWCLLAMPKESGSRELIVPIERLNGFEGFIHKGKFIAGSDSKEELIQLAKANLKNG